MKITTDTNVLVRAITEDDPAQAKLAQQMLEEAELVAMPLLALAEMCWVLERVYRFSKRDVARAVRGLTEAANAAVDSLAVEAGLVLLNAGGDFADGAIAHDGMWLGADTFVTFDRKAMQLVEAAGMSARAPGSAVIQ